MLREYHKIETPFNRDTEGTRKLIPNSFRNETVQFLADCVWDWTEKIDGTNIRVYWDGHTVSFYGRTDRAEIPGRVRIFLEQTFGTPEAEELFEQLFGEKEVTLFGEGYGAKIQKGGGNYIPDGNSFILFDVLIGDVWLTRESVEDIAKSFGIDAVPVILQTTLYDAIRYVSKGPKSTIGTADMEGLVGRPHVEVLDRMGHRVIVKVKVRDFAGLEGL